MNNLNIKQLIQSMSTLELEQIVRDWDELEEKGYIGDCLLRTKVSEMDNYISTGFWIGAVSYSLICMRELLRRGFSPL